MRFGGISSEVRAVYWQKREMLVFWLNWLARPCSVSLGPTRPPLGMSRFWARQVTQQGLDKNVARAIVYISFCNVCRFTGLHDPISHVSSFFSQGMSGNKGKCFVGFVKQNVHLPKLFLGIGGEPFGRCFFHFGHALHEKSLRRQIMSSIPWRERGTLVSWANCSAGPRPAALGTDPTRQVFFGSILLTPVLFLHVPLRTILPVQFGFVMFLQLVASNR